jgi:type IV pilus assembly protein PilM
MATPSRIVALNLGMQTVSMAEFHLLPGGGLSLKNWANTELMVDPASDVTRPGQIEAAVAELRKTLNLQPKDIANYCLPSQSVFTRFVKLPGSSPEDIASIIGFEAQQNVPFPIDEVVWDHQIMGESRDNNWDIVLVAIKADQLGEINSAVRSGGIRAGTIDVAPMALYNAFRYSYESQAGCSLLIDVGARTTNLIFVEGQRAFTRSIPVGGNTISAALGKEFHQDITVAERLKVEKGFVSLGGAYADPEDPTEAKVSKIARNTLTRLHSEIARSISFYRQNQGGGQPVRAYLCGGAVSMPYTLEFFNEKLHMPVEFFNPLRNVTVASAEVAAAVGDKAHVLGELVGAALRSTGSCPIEISLRPESVVREQDLAKRKLFLVGATACLILTLAAWWLYYFRATAITQDKLASVQSEVAGLQGYADQFKALKAEQDKTQAVAGPLELASEERVVWGRILDELSNKLPPRFIWVTSLQPLSNGKPVTFGGTNASSASAPAAAPTRGRTGQRDATPAGPPAIDALQITGLYLANPPNPDENPTKVIDQYVDQLSKSPMFKIEDKVKAVGNRTQPSGENWAYDYSITIPLRTPIALP